MACSVSVTQSSASRLMKIKIRNPLQSQKFQEPVTIGVPCPKGVVQASSSFVFKGQGRDIPVQNTPLTFWPDKSVKWLLCDFLLDIGPGEQICLALEEVTPKKNIQQINYKDDGDTIVVNTGVARFVMDACTLLPFKSVQIQNRSLLHEKGCKIWLKDKDDQILPAVISTIETEISGPIRFTLKAVGHFEHTQKLFFYARIHFYAGTAKTCLEFTLHNPQAAKHPGCIWDLGDPASFLFKELVMSLPINNADNPGIHFKLSPEKEWRTSGHGKSLKIYQESSGGDNWDSPNHRNRDGLVPMKIRGYQVLQNNQIIAQGNRSQPVLWAGSGITGLSLVVPRFWQEFPKALDVNQQTIDISLFPGCFPDLHELQGGEQKTHELYFDFAAEQDNAIWGIEPLQITLEPDAINKSGVFKDIVCGESSSIQYQQFLDAALESQNSFFAKREVVDEYGWRNFGELYADHEAVFHKGTKPFISHYNNQYDPIASFYREFFHTGNLQWYELAFDLARHVIDIDINHTEQDREEYCNGLFWHTNHYLDASLSTHRMVSREHLSSNAKLGGGPSPEHCYTSGLKIHYLFSGNARFRDEAIRLADWSYLAIRRPQTILAALLRSMQSMKKFIQTKKVPNGGARFPFTRGTGNCLNAQLNAFELTGSKKYLAYASNLIKGTLHPNDLIEDRDLLNAEIAWSYTVFLSYLIKFLEVKKTINELDEDFWYGRDSLLHYVAWMAEKEYHYLDKKGILEYPNETWAAQDLRKSVIFYFAAKYTNESLVRDKFHEKAKVFLEKSFNELETHNTRFFTRPLILVLQNGWVSDCTKTILPYKFSKKPNISWGSSPHRSKLSNILFNIITDIKKCSSNTTLRKERAWLKHRLS